MATERKNQFQFELESNPLHKNALKGEAWIRKIYRDLVFKVCKNCGEPFLGSRHICSVCEAKIEEDKKWGNCKCGERFLLEEGQDQKTKKCPKCKEDKYFAAFHTGIMSFFIFYDNIYPRYSLEDKIHEYSKDIRNNVQSSTPYSNFKMPYIFENVDWSIDKTWEHINSMTNLIKSLLYVLLEDEDKRNFKFTKEYLLRYGVQFRTSAAQNYALVPFQNKSGGITAGEYISIVGNIVGKTKEETIDIIKKHFINHG